jgi:hypothetical protein
MTTSITGIPSILSDARYVTDLFNKQKAVQQASIQKPLQQVQLANKMHNDQLATDPTWINGVHCHDSASRHNYTYLNNTK